MIEGSLAPWLNKYLKGFSKDRPHHSYLITGCEGLGKSALSKHLSGYLFCTNNEISICKECQSCKFYLEDNHPDFYLIEKEQDKKNISISQINQLREKIYESAFLGKRKIINIPNIEQMSRDASDAMLKVLEEPPKDTFFVITSSLVYRIPATIRSRSLEIAIDSPTLSEFAKWMGKVNSEDVNLAYFLSSKRPYIAKDLLELNLTALRSDFIEDIGGIIKSGKDLVNVSDRWVKQTDSLPLKLQWMSHILMDSIKYKASKEYAEIMPDTATMTNYLGEKSDIHNLHELLNQTNKLLSMVVSETNLRKEYQLQSLFVDWERKLQISAI